MLNLDSLASRMPQAEALHSALQTGAASAKWLRLTPQLPRPVRVTVSLALRSAAGSSIAPPHSPELHPSPPQTEPYKEVPATMFEASRAWTLEQVIAPLHS